MFEFSLFLFMIVYTFKSTICLQYGGGGGGSSYAKSSGPISAAIKSHYNLEVRNVQLENEPIPEPKIDIESRQIPMVLHFKTQSSKLKIMQTHIGNPGETKRTKSEDEPSVLIHEVRKPVFQQVREIIVPYRKTVQEVKPVQEQVETIVSRGQGGGYGVVKPIYSPKQMPIYKPIPMYSNIPKYPSPPKHQYLYDNGDIDLKSAQF